MRIAYYPKSSHHTNQHPSLVLIFSPTEQRHLFQGLGIKDRRENGRVSVEYDPDFSTLTIKRVAKGGQKLGRIWQPSKERSISLDPANINFQPQHGWGRTTVRTALETSRGVPAIQWVYNPHVLEPLKQMATGYTYTKNAAGEVIPDTSEERGDLRDTLAVLNQHIQALDSGIVVIPAMVERELRLTLMREVPL